VEVVEQPFCRGGDELPGPDIVRQRAVGLRSTRALSSNRGKMFRARRRGFGSMVKLAASASARSSSRSMLSSSSRNGFSSDGAVVRHSGRNNPLTDP
jgi:hypothetical protein